jgi:hypothetical protein
MPLFDGTSKGITWLGVAAVLGLLFVVVPFATTQITQITLPFAEFVGRYIPAWLAPVNWVLLFFLIAICQGPLLKPKSLSIALGILMLACILVFLGSWDSYPSASPVVGLVAFIELNWLIPRWEKAKLNQ